jgi:aminopeptidase N
VRYESRYDADKKTFYLSLSQESNSEQPLHIPISVGLLEKNSGEEVLPTTVLDLKESSHTFEFPGMNEDVLPSVLRGFSAPVKLVGPSKDDEQYLAFLASHDTDGFNRWEAVQKLYTSAIFKSLRSEDTARTMDYIYEAFERSLKLDSDDYSIQAYAMELPTRSTLEEMMDVIDTIGLVHAKKAVMKSIARKFYGQIRDKYTELTSVIEEKEFSVDAESIGQRRLRNVMLDYLCAVDETAEEREIASNLAFDQFKASYGMNDKQNALLNLVKMSEGEDEVIARRENAIQQFYDDAEGDPLVINKWFRLQAQEVALDRVKALSEHTNFTLKNPNRCRSLIGTFATSNPHFHAEDGSGYQFIGEMIAKVDLLNPQVSSRLAKDGLINWSRYPEKQGSLMKAELEKLALMKPISPDLLEIVKNGLK